jgi:two-component system C4-dicarboxylate transport response regulator DctD
VDFRVVAATKVDLREAVTSGTFREDLFYRLNVARITIPPLRQRLEDLPLLLNFFLCQMAERFDRPEPVVSAGLWHRLASYHWPGNVRELRNVAQQLVLELELDLANQTDGKNGMDLALGFDELVQRYEKRIIEEALERCGGRVEKTAQLLGIPRKRLYLRMQKLAISWES